MDEGTVATLAWPTARQELLLKAALDRGPGAVDAWRAWLGEIRLDRVDRASINVLPTAYANLRRQGVDAALLAPARAAYQRATAQSLRLMHLVPELARLAAQDGSPLMLLKGAAMLAAYYDDWGARLIGDIDVLVYERAYVPLVTRFHTLGWQDVDHATTVIDPRFLYATQLRSEAGQDIDVHAHALLEHCAPGVDERYWAAAQPITVRETHVLVPCPADLLYITLMHGTRRGPEQILRWVSDALAILARPGMDWTRLVDTAKTQGLPGVTAGALDYLVRFGVSVPGDALAVLRAAPSDAVALTIRNLAGPERLGHPILGLRNHWAILSGGVGSPSVLARLAAVPRYLQVAWRVYWWELPWAVLRRAGRHVLHRMGWYRYPKEALPL